MPLPLLVVKVKFFALLLTVTLLGWTLVTKLTVV
jgi:hypothetical protein